MEVVLLESLLVFGNHLQRVVLGLLTLIFERCLAKLNSDDFVVLLLGKLIQLLGADRGQAEMGIINYYIEYI